MESKKDRLNRLELMASGNPKWDLSDKDIQAIKYAVDFIKSHKESNPAKRIVMPKIADLQKRNSKLTALLQMRDGGDHDNDCKANYGGQCNCGHNAVKLYFDSNFSA